MLERVLVFGGEGAGTGRLLAGGERLLDQVSVVVGAGAGRLLAGGERFLDQVSIVADKKASPTEVCCQAKGAV